MRRRFNVVIPKDDGGVEVHPMKEWLRQHPEKIPSGMDTKENTSHQLRNNLNRLGWKVQETDTEVRLIPPDSESVTEIVKVLGGADDEVEEDESPIFRLEYQLRDFLAENIQTITLNGKKLKLFIDSTGRDGIEYPTAVGMIDILAVDEEEAFYVFELKRGRGSDKVVGQVTRYMGWVSDTIGKGKEVNGVIVAKTIGDRLRYSASVVPKVYLFEYQVEFHLKEANAING
ncbi:MAG TPA: DUF91 domain-containing protein [Chloroflexi bacterium]|nr:MAG: hypothetical protein B6I38_09570 [Anaerolineaceae bacterium 4572_5.1]HEY85017.1 DUF91 domain-containing protein [Chloroflexota bacterium]